MSRDFENIIFYDGECGICNRLVMEVLKRDYKEVFFFCSLQSSRSSELLASYEVESDGRDPHTMYVISGTHLYQKSEAILEIASVLFPHGHWIWKSIRVIPLQLRDKVYTWVAQNRHRFFTQRHSCRNIKTHWQDRFLR